MDDDVKGLPAREQESPATDFAQAGTGAEADYRAVRFLDVMGEVRME